MLLYILDKEFNNIEIIDSFNSYLWADRYAAYGDFEYYSDASTKIINSMKTAHYIWSDESEHTMIIEDLYIDTDIEMGANLSVKGRSAESILEWRIVWQQTLLNGNLQTEVKRLIDENIINPIDIDRKLPNFKFQFSEDPEITKLTIHKQFTGDTVYKAIQDICKEFGLGFKIILSDENEFIFSLFKGIDRSYRQEKNSYVVFSPEFDNLLNSNYYKSISNYKNVALIAGDGEGLDRKTATLGESSGYDRREVYIDARDISSIISKFEGGDDTESYVEYMPDEEYKDLLYERGKSKMIDYKEIETFEGNVDFTRMYIINKDFFIGDIIQIWNEFGLESVAQITEVITSYDGEGKTVVPTFEKVNNEY